MRPAHAGRLAAATAELLARHGIDPDTVGEMVVEAIQAGKRFVLTDRAAEGNIRERAQLIIDAMPEASTSSPAGESIYRSAASIRQRQ